MQTLAEDELRQLIAHIQALTARGAIRHIYLNRYQCDAPQTYLKEISQIKRLLERWSADDAFRRRMETDAGSAAQSLGLSLDVEGLKYLWDEHTALSTPVDSIALSALRYRSFILEKITHRNHLRANTPDMDPRFARWRVRQMKRAENELSVLSAGSIVHAPFCMELCHGCSVGCWFCGISAPRLEDIFLYTAENAALFEGVVEALSELLGSAAGRGFLYWATDPMDNPDYEKFLSNFHHMTGAFPQTTTALALKDISRTRALLELSREKHGMLDRFSLLTLSQLDRVHREFTPEELLYVELVTQNREGHQAKAKAGRVLSTGVPRRGDRPMLPGEQSAEGTIACVSGFLINMAHRTMKLISPCRASARWPLGYIVFDEATFRDARDFRQQMLRMAEEHMFVDLEGPEPLGWFDFLNGDESGDVLRLKGANFTAQFGDNPVYPAIGRMLRDRRPTTDEVVDGVSLEIGVQPAEVLYALNVLLAHGVLDTYAPPPQPVAKEVLYEVTAR